LLSPSLWSYTAAAQQEEEGDGSSWSYSATQLHNRKKKATATTVAFFVELHCSYTRGRRRRRQLPLPFLWSCATALQQNKSCSATLPFSLCYTTKRSVSCGALVQSNSTNNQTNKIDEKKKLDAYLGPAPAPAAPLLQAPATSSPPSSPARSSLLLDVSGAVAMEGAGGRGW